MKIKYGIMAYTKETDENCLRVFHFCGYENPITDAMMKDLENELNTDPEFGLVGRINKDVFLVEACEDMVKFYAEDVERHEANGNV